MKKWKSTHGAISVFLSIILVPCIALTTLFVDLGRVNLAKQLTEASGDLALNSLLTNYDYDLNDFYGMVTSCQNIDEFYEGSIEYFTRLLKSQGLSPEESKTLLAKAGALIDNKEISDMLQVEVKNPKITSVNNANLSNATVAKDQIVDFMKYRAPINIVTGFLGDLGNQSKAIEDTEKDRKLSEDKQEYYEAESDFMAKAYEIYIKLRNYQNTDPAGAGKESRINETVTRMNSYRTTYEKIHEALVKDLFNTQSIGDVIRPQFTTTQFQGEFTRYSTSNPAKLEDLLSSASKPDIKRLCSELAANITTFINKKVALDNALNGTQEYNSSSMYFMQYWAQNYTKVNTPLAEFTTAGRAMIRKYNELKNAWENMEATPLPSEFKWKFSAAGQNQYVFYDQEKTATEHYYKLKEAVEGLQSDYLNTTVGSENKHKFLRILQSLQNISTNNDNKKRKDPTDAFGNGINGKSVEQIVIDVYNQMTSDRAKMVELSDALKGVDTLLGELRSLRQSMQTEFNQWNNTANATDTDMGEDDRKVDIVKTREMLNKVSEADINELRTRVTNMKKLFDDVIKAIDDMTYGNKKVKDINNFSAARSASGISEGSIPLMTNDLSMSNASSYTRTSFKFVPATGNAIEVTINISNNPDLNKSPAPKTWSWMNNETDFAKTVPADKTQRENEYKNHKKNGNDKKTGDQTTPVDASFKNVNLTGTGNSYGFGTALSSLVNLAKGLSPSNFNNTIVNMRDSLYATEYVTSMFSSYTFETDRFFKEANDGNGKYNGSRINQNLMVNTIRPEFSKFYETKGFWDTVKPYEAFNYSLTTKPINSANNHGYRAEWEYVLYGKDTSQANVNRALTEMYAIRFIMNTPSGYMLFWNQNNNTARALFVLSSLISSATLGIIPEPLVRAVLILVVIALESANDISMLANGFPVKFLKTGDKNPDKVEWALNIELDGTLGSSVDTLLSGSFKNLFPLITNTYSGFHVSYNQYLYLFLILGFNSGGTVSQAMYNRTGNLIQHNMNLLIHGNGNKNDSESWKLSKAIVYFNIEATVRVKPLMLTIPISTSYAENPKDKTDWCTFNYKTSRGYS